MVYADPEFRSESDSPWLLLGVLLLSDFVPVDTFAHLFIHSYKCGASGGGRYKGDHVSKYLVHNPPPYRHTQCGDTGVPHLGKDVSPRQHLSGVLMNGEITSDIPFCGKKKLTVRLTA